MRYELHHGDCLDVLKTLADCSVDAIVTDPPYGLSFMGKRWDYDVPTEAVWVECLRVLKPGGHLLAFAGTRTQHRMAVRIEDAGFEIRDMIFWCYGQGFPKSLDVSKAIDKMGGEPVPPGFSSWLREERERRGWTAKELCERGKFYKNVNHGGLISNWEAGIGSPSAEQFNLLCEILELSFDRRKVVQREILGWRDVSPGVAFSSDGASCLPVTAPATQAAKQWEGWGTALKPAVEPVGVYHKGLTLENVFGILMASLTQELWRSICQWSNASASDAENLLSGIRARLEKAEAFSVVESARTFALENIESAILAASSSISPKLTETARDTTKGGSAQEGANPSGRKLDMQGTETQAGRVDVMSLVDMFICATTEHTGQNIALLWSGILGETLNQANTFTIATALRLTTALKTLKCLMQANTLQSTGSLESCRPSLEPITLARKPPIGTIAANVLEHGTGGLNIDGCRVETNPEVDDPRLGGKGDWSSDKMAKNVYEGGYAGDRVGSSPLGRFPANFIHDGSDEVMALFPETTSGQPAGVKAGNNNNVFGQFAGGIPVTGYGDSGSAARFFYCAKTSKKDRGDDNKHPTVKPTDLMRYLCRLVTPPGGLILDPFMGSGSTGKAAMLEGFRFIGIEQEAEYLEIAEARIAHVVGKTSGMLPFE
jgi:DNA modification methylase/transcriptional regulator with XRE-family HTH domain